ncbi:ImmA/IrrE family metallo-endopeptidase [Paenibacillus eucommiae]|uniref:IrrE N-terminal-like domain-containing protein n=1 Tax=Paenibacillus eucommiae TaxID=1355755 RepID=A0ABS4IRL5_9BACL|nr:ImmA/IrrE family metallo-endopeptidase [Paenibacillus eucommiae]MBP1990219.1 hypothetical protein [Paenibacillus eucommiae]
MASYEELLDEADKLAIQVYEKPMQTRNKGLYMDGVIWINDTLSGIEKACILAEELGHYHTSEGDILDQSKLTNRKQELRARQWGYSMLLPLSAIVQAHHAKAKGRHEIAEHLNVTEDFLQAAIDRYTEKYGLFVLADDQHYVYFDPLRVVEIFDI